MAALLLSLGFLTPWVQARTAPFHGVAADLGGSGASGASGAAGGQGGRGRVKAWPTPSASRPSDHAGAVPRRAERPTIDRRGRVDRRRPALRRRGRPGSVLAASRAEGGCAKAIRRARLSHPSDPDARLVLTEADWLALGGSAAVAVEKRGRVREFRLVAGLAAAGLSVTAFVFWGRAGLRRAAGARDPHPDGKGHGPQL